MAARSATGSRPATPPITVQPGQERWFFETYFEPSIVTGPGRSAPHRLFRTRHPGEPRLGAAASPSRCCRRPPDMVTVDLGAFAEAYDSDALRGAPRSLNGKLNGNRIEPYPKREAITPYQGQIIGYAHPADVYNLQVQGSGRLRFAGRHGGARAVLRAERLQVEFRSRRAAQFGPARSRRPGPTSAHWLDHNPGEQKSALNADPSYVFFQEETIADPSAGPKGAAGDSADADGLDRGRSRLPSLWRRGLRRRHSMTASPSSACLSRRIPAAPSAAARNARRRLRRLRRGCRRSMPRG